MAVDTKDVPSAESSRAARWLKGVLAVGTFLIAVLGAALAVSAWQEGRKVEISMVARGTALAQGGQLYMLGVRLGIVNRSPKGVTITDGRLVVAGATFADIDAIVDSSKLQDVKAAGIDEFPTTIGADSSRTIVVPDQFPSSVARAGQLIGKWERSASRTSAASGGPSIGTVTVQPPLHVELKFKGSPDVAVGR
jgi:hypothetical protein